VENEGKVTLIHGAEYGGRSARRSCVDHIEFKSYPADPVVWIRSAIKSDGTEAYAYFFYTQSLLELKLSQS
jgi:hypothetical protein